MQKLVTKRVFETLVEVGDRSTLRLLQTLPTALYNYPFGILPKELENQLIGAGNQLVWFSRSSVYLKLFQSICERKENTGTDRPKDLGHDPPGSKDPQTARPMHNGGDLPQSTVR